MIEEDHTASQIAKKLDRDKQLISYHICKLKAFGYVKEKTRDAYKAIEKTHAGKNFLDQYTTIHSNNSRPICRLENIGFKASVYKMPPPESGTCKACGHNHTFKFNYEGVKSSINLIPKLFKEKKILES